MHCFYERLGNGKGSERADRRTIFYQAAEGEKAVTTAGVALVNFPSENARLAPLGMEAARWHCAQPKTCLQVSACEEQ